MSFFSEYYQNVLAHKTGFKLVLGGTGLGKTTGIIETVKQNPSLNQRFFYMAHRIQLLNEMAAKLEKETPKLGYCFQQNDADTLGQLDKSTFEKLLEDAVVSKYATIVFQKSSMDLGQLKRDFALCQELRKISKNKEGAAILNEKCGKVLSFLKKILKEVDFTKENSDKAALLKNETILKLFPYLDFKYHPTEKRICLMTLQKAFYGFFDGKGTVNLNNLENGAKEQNIIFLDEFDFLETELLSHLCKDTVIEQPFDFVDAFYKLKKYKLTHDNFSQNHPDLKVKLQDIINDIASLSSKNKIDFPEKNHFVCTDKRLLGNSIFQSRYSMGSKALYFNPNKRSNSFHIEEPTPGIGANSFRFLQVIHKSTKRIVRLFKKLEEEDPAAYDSLLNHCFSTSDRYKKALRLIKQHPSVKKAFNTNTSIMYYEGYGLYEIFKLDRALDPEEVELKYYSIFNTPESILLGLTKKNLVFGLSATGEIYRYVNNFDLNWLKGELGENYFYPNPQDIAMIQAANHRKSFGTEQESGRNNSVQVEQAFDVSFPEVENLIAGLDIKEPELLYSPFYKDRLRLFFSTLKWIAEQTNVNKSHLLFFSSLKQIKHIFEHETLPEDEFYAIEKLNNGLTDCYTILLKGTKSIVLFLDAAQGKDIAKDNDTKEAYYQLFWKNLPVLVVTTYPSAGNGVNLFYYQDKAKTIEKDFANVHLLDSPFYFFGEAEQDATEQEQIELLKFNIYHLAKLYNNQIIIPKHFKFYLDKIREINSFNKFYIDETEDGLCNLVAIYIQAIGRIERIWSKMDSQVIRLRKEVYNHLERFIEQCEPMYRKNEPFFSHNIQQVFLGIREKQVKRQLQQSHEQEEHLQNINNQCIESIEKLLSELKSLRANQLTPENAKRVRGEWQRLRQLALGHRFSDFENESVFQNYNKVLKFKTAGRQLLKDYHCIFKTAYYNHVRKSLYIDKKTNYIVPHEINPDNRFSEWKLDTIYEQVKNNLVLRNHFEYWGYPCEFLGNGQYFTPYFYQSVLAGAIGEECVKAVFNILKIELEDDVIADTLFELMDCKIKGKHWYIDCKNYGEQTIAHFQLEYGDPFYHPKLNEGDFIKKAKEKWEAITRFHAGESSVNCKIMYINVFGTGNYLIGYYNASFEPVSSFEAAKIIVVPAMFEKVKPLETASKPKKATSATEKSIENDKKTKEDHYCQNFNRFITELKKSLKND